LLEALNVDKANGALRLSFVHYTTQNEVSDLIRSLDELL
jgi:selenocysteine lyase/cysteine desulfurase